MHPVKAEEAIAEAYFEHGVRTFSLDSMEELEKIVRATVDDGVAATDLTLLRPPARVVGAFEAQPRVEVRRRAARGQGAAVRRPPGGRRARHLLPRRQPGDDARRPMPRRWSACARRSSRRRSRSTSSMSAAASRRPIRAWSRRRSRPISQSIHRAFEALPISYSAELWCEPGRALCAEYASSLIVRVEKRRGDELYINDGAYGALFDAAHIGWRFPVAAAARARQSHARTMAFSFYGPTCDDLDHMAGPFMLPADVAGRRLYRDRHARRLWLRDADRVQRLRRRTRR